MGFEAKKTEHCGPKRGNGAYWGYRWDAKKESNRIRRENWKREIRDEVASAESKEYQRSTRKQGIGPPGHASCQAFASLALTRRTPHAGSNWCPGPEDSSEFIKRLRQHRSRAPKV